MDALCNWLSHAEGPDLIDIYCDPPIEDFRVMAIGVDPDLLYKDSEEPVVGLGIILKPPYIGSVSFETATAYFDTWLGKDSGKILADPCLMFISVSIESKILPHCKGYPVLLDLASKEAVKNNTVGGSLREFRSFRLPQVLAVEDPKSTDYSLCVGYPRL